MSDLLFREKAPGVMRALMFEFSITPEDSAAILGNAGHESGGFRLMQEIKPTVKGSAGGLGWFQWTGLRRKNFIAYAIKKDLDPASDLANYSFLVSELKGAYHTALSAVKDANTLDDKVKAFERAYERAGVKAYASRLKWAQIALEAWHGIEATKSIPTPPPTMATSREGNTAIATGAGGALIAATEAIKQAQESGDTIASFIHAMGSTIFLVAMGIIVAAGAIWYWRRERMRQHGV